MTHVHFAGRAYINKRKTPHILKLIGVLLLAQFLFGCDVLAQPTQSEGPATFETMRIQETHQDYTIDIAFPLTNNSKIDHTLSQFISQRLIKFKDDLLETSQTEARSGDNQYILNARIAYQSENVFAIRVSESAGIGKKEALEIVHTFNFNRLTGEDIALDNLFPHQENYLKVISELCYQRLLEDTRLLGVDAALLKDGTLPFTQNFSSFLFEDDTITLIFNSGQVAPAAFGAISIHIPLEDLTQQMTFNPKAFEAGYISVYPIFPVLLEGVAPSESAYFNTAKTSSVKAGDKLIALTFDDGPHPKYTPQVLKILENHQIRATFFMIGKRARAFPDIVKSLHDAGHTIGNHTWSHPQLTKLDKQQIMAQIDMTQRTIDRITGVNPKIVRVPYGRFNAEIHQWINMPLIQWSVDPEDWKSRDAQKIAGHVIAHAKPGGIVLLHDIQSATVEALPSIIEQLSLQGYTFVTVEELFELNKKAVYYQQELKK